MKWNLKKHVCFFLYKAKILSIYVYTKSGSISCHNVSEAAQNMNLSGFCNFTMTAKINPTNEHCL